MNNSINNTNFVENFEYLRKNEEPFIETFNPIRWIGIDETKHSIYSER